jgi:hypothetical protein
MARAIRPCGHPLLDADPELKRRSGATRSTINFVKSFPPGFCNKILFNSTICQTFKFRLIKMTYNVFRILVVNRCIRNNRFFKEEWTVRASSPEEPIANSLGFSHCADMFPNDSDGVQIDIRPFVVDPVISLG